MPIHTTGSVKGVTGHTLYQLNIMYRDQKKRESDEYKKLADIFRFSDGQSIPNPEHYKSFKESL